MQMKIPHSLVLAMLSLGFLGSALPHACQSAAPAGGTAPGYGAAGYEEAGSNTAAGCDCPHASGAVHPCQEQVSPAVVNTAAEVQPVEIIQPYHDVVQPIVDQHIKPVHSCTVNPPQVQQTVDAVTELGTTYNYDPAAAAAAAAGGAAGCNCNTEFGAAAACDAGASNSPSQPATPYAPSPANSGGLRKRFGCDDGGFCCDGGLGGGGGHDFGCCCPPEHHNHICCPQEHHCFHNQDCLDENSNFNTLSNPSFNFCENNNFATSASTCCPCPCCGCGGDCNGGGGGGGGCAPDCCCCEDEFCDDGRCCDNHNQNINQNIDNNQNINLDLAHNGQFGQCCSQLFPFCGGLGGGLGGGFGGCNGCGGCGGGGVI